jgi:hypothetical protein
MSIQDLHQTVLGHIGKAIAKSSFTIIDGCRPLQKLALTKVGWNRNICQGSCLLFYQFSLWTGRIESSTSIPKLENCKADTRS